VSQIQRDPIEPPNLRGLRGIVHSASGDVCMGTHCMRGMPSRQSMGEPGAVHLPKEVSAMLREHDVKAL